MKPDTTDDIALEQLFQEARAAPPKMPEGLMARVLADAEAAQPVSRRTKWRDWLRAIGGAPGAAGLITASCLWFWIGVAPPAALPDLAGQMLTGAATDAGDLTLTGFDAVNWELDEG